jgi:hypothetical protein
MRRIRDVVAGLNSLDVTDDPFMDVAAAAEEAIARRSMMMKNVHRGDSVSLLLKTKRGSLSVIVFASRARLCGFCYAVGDVPPKGKGKSSITFDGGPLLDQGPHNVSQES